MSEKEPVVLCAASSYEQKYYLNEAFSGLPTAVKEELQVMCVLYTADVGGILYTSNSSPETNKLFFLT